MATTSAEDSQHHQDNPDYSKISIVAQESPIEKKKGRVVIDKHQQSNLYVNGSSTNSGSNGSSTTNGNGPTTPLSASKHPLIHKSNNNSNKMQAMQSNGGIVTPDPVRSSEHHARHRGHGSHSNHSRPARTTSRLAWHWFRLLLLELPQTLLLACLLSVYSIRSIYQDLYRPLMDRATRTDGDLHDEFTYYHRYCTQADLTTRNIGDMVADPKAPVAQAMEQMMEHGAVVVPNLLSPTTVRKLREYAVYKNEAIPEEEVYPVSQGTNRMSFGYDATESPIVVQALQELTNHQFLKQLLANLLGDADPASSEITSITAYYNAPPQAWHSDTKEDGNALKFARTYSHSYSLFVPLQNTTKPMGMTDICPGTHYCGNDLSNMCENTKLSLADADPSGPHFRAGDGALLNQIVWHRGAAHKGKNTLERIVFIVSFLARPDMQHDPRQLSRGTYFHQRWLMWGHTWKDLMDPMLSMQKPFSYLRCMSLWKPPSHNWGYDLITSGFMRFANEQLEDHGIAHSLWPRLDQIHFPHWLRSDLPDEDEGQKASWIYFLDGTIGRTLDFFRQAFLTVFVLYLFVCLLVALVYLAKRRISVSDTLNDACVEPFKRLTPLNIVAFLTIFSIWYSIRNSPWGKAVLDGKALMRPFPKVTLATSDELALISKGPTTFPVNQDVLFGTRYDAKFLGVYEGYLNWHRGNKAYRKAIAGYAPLVESYKRLPSEFDRRLIDNIIATVTSTRGRFLEQDYRNGAWRILLENEIEARIRRDLAYAASGVKMALQQPLRRMIALDRFGFGRGTSLKRKGVVHLHLLEKQLIGGNDRIAEEDKETPRRVQLVYRDELLMQPPTSNARRITHDPVPAHRRDPPSSEDEEDDEPFPIGCSVYTIGHARSDTEGWDRGEVMAIDPQTGEYTLALESGFQRYNVPHDKIYEYNPTTEGDEVEGCYDEDLEECFTGTVLQVNPDGSVAIEFEDGDFDPRFPAQMIHTPPIEYFPE